MLSFSFMSSQSSLTLCHKSLCTVFSLLLTNILWHSPPAIQNQYHSSSLSKVGSYEQGPNGHSVYLWQLDVTLKESGQDLKTSSITNVPHQGPWKLDCLKNTLCPLTSSLFYPLPLSFSPEIRREKRIQIRDPSNRF